MWLIDGNWDVKIQELCLSQLVIVLSSSVLDLYTWKYPYPIFQIQKFPQHSI